MNDAPNLNTTPVLGGAPSLPTGAITAAPPAPAPEAPKPQDDPNFASKFAAISKREKELFSKQQELKKLQEKYAKYEELEKLRAEDPYRYAKETNLDLDRLILGATKDGVEPTAEEKYQAKVDALEKKIADYEAGLERDKIQKAEREQQQTIDSFKKSIQDKLKADPDKYELIHLEDAFDTVYDVIAEHFQRTSQDGQQGEVLGIEDAADKVENWLLEKATKYRQAKKLGFAKAETPPAPSLEAAAPANLDALPDDERGATLSAAMTSRTPPPTPRYESPEEARARIAAEFNAKLRAQKS